MADVYDEWYADVSDVDATVAALARLVAEGGGGPVLELGIGHRSPRPAAGRSRRSTVSGRRRLAGDGRPAAGQAGRRARSTWWSATWPTTCHRVRSRVVFVAFNTFFGLTTAEAQARCFAAVADRLAPGGCVRRSRPSCPTTSSSEAGSRVEVRSLSGRPGRADGQPPRRRRAAGRGQFVELTEAGGVRLRPWSLRYAPPAELDAMAAAAGLGWSAAAGRPGIEHAVHRPRARTTSRCTATSARPARLGWEHSEPAQIEPSERAVGHHRRRASRASRTTSLRARQQVEADPGRACPFCPGSEDATPPALETQRRDGAWQVRVVPNRYPAFEGEDSMAVHNLGPVHVQADASGIHEVIVLSPEPHRELEGPGRRRRGHGDGGAAQPHGRAGPPRQHPLHAGHRQPGPGGGRLARPPARPAPRHALRAR